ncbi:hypothetical protein L1987_18176 [Smallanthus sonchifolius]|uniref:Uncharacterized protein n=1 Tax=Smallanthus sonchifolius TaxID=185202 RepID=A0ACB9J173_9ASTR|nr:hypothetical protein L1987_18176 [Smallanthus sonchifolius]
MHFQSVFERGRPVAITLGILAVVFSTQKVDHCLQKLFWMWPATSVISRKHGQSKSFCCCLLAVDVLSVSFLFVLGNVVGGVDKSGFEVVYVLSVRGRRCVCCCCKSGCLPRVTTSSLHSICISHSTASLNIAAVADAVSSAIVAVLQYLVRSSKMVLLPSCCSFTSSCKLPVVVFPNVFSLCFCYFPGRKKEVTDKNVLYLPMYLFIRIDDSAITTGSSADITSCLLK